jgi:hypothetical protein
MSALGPILHGKEEQRRSGIQNLNAPHTKPEEILKKRAENTKYLKRLIINAANLNTVDDEFQEQKRALISERLRQEDDEKLMQHMINSPVRKGDEGPITFIGK